MPIAQLSEVRLEYFEYGHGPQTVVFVHGYQSSGRIWYRTQQALPADRYRTIAINNRGAGQSDAPPDERDFTIQKFAADLHEFIMQMGIGRFTLVGHSMGGATVAQYAVDHPEQVAALVLLDPASPNGVPLAGAQLEALLDERMAQRRDQMARGAESEVLDAGANATAAAGANACVDAAGAVADAPADIAGVAERAAAAQTAQLLQDIRLAPERRLRGSLRSMLQVRLAERVKTLPMPVLLVAGDRDVVIPLSDMLASWAMYPPGTGLHVWHGVGHSPNLDCPDELAALLARFIEATRVGGAR